MGTGCLDGSAGGASMRMVFSVDLNNRHQQDKDRLEACVRDALLAFNLRAHAEANVKSVRVFSDEANVYLGPITRPRVTKAS
jgi:hypothetical protein